MVTATNDNVKVTKEVKRGLIKLKQYPRETFNDTIERLIKGVKAK